jgi:hypothetical protein
MREDTPVFSSLKESNRLVPAAYSQNPAFEKCATANLKGPRYIADVDVRMIA